ncbi:hypothetical protein B296_00036234 [Ensete ventricosum]|uniref:Uncharacterized protein n=1 Tax=Ensete ventricosum TaxID=4639 RepID=A0A426ZH65_ENSVE|nr:hypothetical protein B296_00036234 [Ensete ventricosum]
MASEKSSSGLSKSCILIIGTYHPSQNSSSSSSAFIVERFAYKGVASNLLSYLTDHVKMSTSSAAKSVSTWSGVTSMLPLASAILADSYWDRYSTIMASSLLYIVVIFSTNPSFNFLKFSENELFMFSSFTGTGGIDLMGVTVCMDANLLPVSSPLLDLHWTRWIQPILAGVWSGSIGDGRWSAMQHRAREERQEESLLPVVVLRHLQWQPLGELHHVLHPGHLGLGTGLRHPHRRHGDLGRLLPVRLSVLRPQATQDPQQACREHHPSSESRCDEDQVQKPRFTFQGCSGARVSNCSSCKALTLTCCLSDLLARLLCRLQEKPLRDGSADCSTSSGRGNSAADEAPGVGKTILRLLPIWTMLLMFAVIFQQPVTFFTRQGMMMRRSIGGGITIPPAMLQSAITISIILIMPLYDKLIIPLLRLLTRQEKGINVLQRIGIGMCLSVVAMVVAAVVESKRIGILRTEGGSHEPLQLDSQLTIFWLLPQYILLGISDVFTVVGMQEFFYMEVPTTMRTIGIALYLSVFGVGSFLSALLISVLEWISNASGKHHNWLSDDTREARLDNYYWFLALLSSISFLIFACLCRYYNHLNAAEN